MILSLTGSLAGITLCPFVLLPRHGFVINLFLILLSGRSAVGNMPVRGLKPHVLGELDLGICFNLSTFDIPNWKATEINSFSLSLKSCVICQFFYSNHSGALFSSWGVGMFMAPILFLSLAILSAATDTNSTVGGAMTGKSRHVCCYPPCNDYCNICSKWCR